MKVSDIVNNKIDRLRTGYIFTYDDFDIPVDKVDALKKVLSRLVASGKIARLSKGQFYKPERSEFGVLRPPEYQVVKDLLEENNKIVGYLTGVSVYNKFGLTTQVSNTILIGTNIDRKPRKRGKYSIRFVKQRNTITNENIEKLQLLDAIRFIKRIPDANVSQSCFRIISIINKYSIADQQSIIKYALKYNPGTRALLGAILDQVNNSIKTESLYSSLNPATEFKIGITDDVLITKEKWRIV